MANCKKACAEKTAAKAPVEKKAPAKKKEFNIATASVVKKVTFGYFGDPKGYETTMYITEDGNYFLYTNGGCESPYAEEKITAYTKAKAEKWIKEN